MWYWVKGSRKDLASLPSKVIEYNKSFGPLSLVISKDLNVMKQNYDYHISLKQEHIAYEEKI